MSQSGRRVILDTNAVIRFRTSAQDHLRPGEDPVMTRGVVAELRWVSRRPRMFIPKVANQFEVTEDIMAVNVRINIRGAVRAAGSKRGLFADGIVGATAYVAGYPVITMDRNLATVLRNMGVDVRP